MNPRTHVRSGLPGVGQERFPEQARQSGRELGLYGVAAILVNSPQEDGGGAFEDSWAIAATVDARVDPIGAAGAGETTANQIDETSTHIITFYPDADVDASGRVEMEDKVWTVTAVLERTDKLVRRAEARSISVERLSS